VGIKVGDGVGSAVVGLNEVGVLVDGWCDGSSVVGDSVGCLVGSSVVGFGVGLGVGESVGSAVGS